MTKRITVLICTHNRRALLEKALASLDCMYPPTGWSVEVKVIANACTDDTLEFLSRRSNVLPLTFDHELRPGKSHALNSALPTIDSDAVAFVDDDHRVGRDYIESVCEAFSVHEEADIICGRILPDWDGTEPDWVHEQGQFRIYPLPVPRFDLGDEYCVVDSERSIPGGGNIAVRTPWLTRIGEFSISLGPTGHNLGGAEDIEWVKRGLALGAHLYYAPRMIQYHYVEEDRLRTNYIVRKAFIRSSSIARIEGVRPALYMVRKIFGYLSSAAFSFDSARRRFYLVRLAASLGELHGSLKKL
jgi:glycosyltransferase involved in cell wall biosynthesis